MNSKLPFIEKGQSSGAGFGGFSKRATAPSRLLFGIYSIGVFIFFLFAIVRLFQLTVVKGAYYGSLAENNRIREIVIEAPRGMIRDRKGVILASNNERSPESALERVKSERIYYKAETTSHIIGYRQTADKNDIENDPCLNKLKLGDKTGKNGVEKLYECALRGSNGKKIIEVDAHGAYKQTMNVIDPIPGKELTLSVDVFLQEKAQDLMRDKKGAVVAVKPDTGEVLTLVSSPWYNPQVFEDGDSKVVSELFTDKDKPMYNRATEGMYPPGSVFKMFVATAGLEENAVQTDTIIEDKGVVKAGAQDFHNWYYLEYGQTEGDVDIFKALQRSNDIYFYKLGEKLGPEKIKKWAELFGFQRRSGIGLTEREGIIPTSFWKEDVMGEQWYLGDTYNLSIGQGYVTVNPLQITMGTAAFANNRKLCKPLLLKVGSASAQDPQCTEIPMEKKTYDIVREGMKQACATGGTGWPFFEFSIDDKKASAEAKLSTESAKLTKKKISVGCKTGTAESHAESGKPHAWFTIFAPFEKPEIALSVLVEEGGQGSDVAAPIAKEILKSYFERKE